MSTEIHEASHAAVAMRLGRRVDHVEVAVRPWRDEDRGHCRVPVGRRLRWNQLPIILAGRMSTDAPGWPPPYDHAREEPREALGLVLGRLGATKDEYRGAVEFTRWLLNDPDFVRLRDAIARALCAVPRLEADDLDRIAAALDTPTPDREEEPLAA